METKQKRHLVLGITGSVATVKIPELCVKLADSYDIKIIATQSALHFLDIAEEYEPEYYHQYTSLNISVMVDKDEWEHYRSVKKDSVVHVDIRKWGDILAIIPLTANTLAKMTNGICDNLLTNTYRAWGSKKPIIVAPCMNTEMFNHPITSQQLSILHSWNIEVIDPVEKLLACGDYGKGALPPVDEVVRRVVRIICFVIEENFISILDPFVQITNTLSDTMAIYIWLLLILLYPLFFRNLPGGYLLYLCITKLRCYLFHKVNSLTDDLVLTFRVWFCDIDYYGHMNNCVYNTYADYGRYGLGEVLFGAKRLSNIYCVIAASNVQYIRSLRLFQKFTLRSSIICMQGRYVWFKHIFESHGKVYCIAIMKCVFMNTDYKAIDFKETFNNCCDPRFDIHFTDEKEYAADSYDTLGKSYIDMTNLIADDLIKDYQSKSIPMIVRSTRSNSISPIEENKVKSE